MLRPPDTQCWNAKIIFPGGIFLWNWIQGADHELDLCYPCTRPYEATIPKGKQPISKQGYHLYSKAWICAWIHCRHGAGMLKGKATVPCKVAICHCASVSRDNFHRARWSGWLQPIIDTLCLALPCCLAGLLDTSEAGLGHRENTGSDRILFSFLLSRTHLKRSHTLLSLCTFFDLSRWMEIYVMSSDGSYRSVAGHLNRHELGPWFCLG